MRKIFALLGLLLCGTASAHSYQQGAIRIGHIHAQPAAAGDNVGIFTPLLNTGTVPDQLNSAESAWAAQVELDDATGAALSNIALPPDQPVTLSAHGAHLTFIGLKQPLNPGAMVPLTLHFAHAGVMQVEVMIEAAP